VGRRTPGRNGNYTSTLEPADPARVGTIRRSFLPARGRYSWPPMAVGRISKARGRIARP